MEPTNPYAAPVSDHTLEAPETPSGEVLLATRSSRFAARVFDNFLLFGLPAVAGIMAALDKDAPRNVLIYGVLALGFVALIIVQAALITTRGQSIGKIVAKIRVERLDGSLPGFVHGVLLRDWLAMAVSAIPTVGSLLNLADALWIFQSDQRCLHDLVAGTRVVQVVPEVK